MKLLRLIRRMLSLSIVVYLLFSVSIYATANTLDNGSCEKDVYSFVEEDFGELFDIIIKNPEDYGVQDYIDKDFIIDDLSILDQVDFIESIDSTESASNVIYHFPVMIKGRIALIYDVLESNNGYTSTLGSDFSPLMNSIVCDEKKYANFYQDDYNFYALTPNCIYTQEGNEVSVSDVNNFDFAKISNIQAENNVYYSFECSEIYTEAAITSIQNHSDKSSAYSTAVTGTKNLSGYPIVHQKIGTTQYGMCWAATVASMAKFEKPTLYSNLSAKNVCDYMGIGYNEGGTNNEAKTALNHYLGSPYLPTIKSVLSTNDIYTIINNVDPAYMQCRRKVGLLSYKYHAVALTGYSYTSTKTTIRIMDPAYECFKICTYADGNWTFAFGDSTYTWYKTIRLLYS